MASERTKNLTVAGAKVFDSRETKSGGHVKPSEVIRQVLESNNGLSGTPLEILADNLSVEMFLKEFYQVGVKEILPVELHRLCGHFKHDYQDNPEAFKTEALNLAFELEDMGR